MPLSIANSTGDGIQDHRVQTNITLPDSGTSVLISGFVLKMGATTAFNVTGSPLTMPAAPGAGSIYWNIQVDMTTGAATVQQSTSAFPAAINANNVVVFQQTLGTTSTDAALAPDSTPDTF